MIDRLLSLLLLVLIYAVVVNSFALADLLLGLLIALALILATRRYVFQPEEHDHGPPLRRFIAFFPFLWAIVREVVASTWRVLLISMRVRPLRQAGIVAVPMDERSDQGVLATAYVVTFTPGSFLVDLDWDQRVMFFHVMDATDPGAVRDSYDQFYRRYQKAVFP